MIGRQMITGPQAPHLRRVLDIKVQYCGTWETQVRGMLHRHVLMFRTHAPW
jgi:hypothetical protein